jgi:hypothetical protein
MDWFLFNSLNMTEGIFHDLTMVIRGADEVPRKGWHFLYIPTVVAMRYWHCLVENTCDYSERMLVESGHCSGDSHLRTSKLL